MEAVLKFNIPEEQSEFEMASNASKWHLVLWDLDQWLREQLKHAQRPEIDCVILQEVRSKIYELMEDENIRFD